MNPPYHPQSTPRPMYDTGGIFAKYGDAYKANHPLSPQQLKVLHDLSKCRTSFLGGHLYTCSDECGFEEPHYNSCRNRHCPKCQGIAMRLWVNNRLKELLPVPYFHNVCTIPHSYNILVPYNDKLIYDILFEAAHESLDLLAKKYFNGKLGIIAVLHTWGQTLSRHIHLHCLVTGGALSFDETRWFPSYDKYLFNVHELSALFRDLFCKKMRKAFKKGEFTFKHKSAILADPVCFEAFIKEQEQKDWVIYCKKPFAGSAKVMEYLGRYTHRVALSNRRIKSVSNGNIVIDYKDYNDLDANKVPKHKDLKLTITGFITLFLLHVLPKGYRKIRYFGILGGQNKIARLQKCRDLIAQQNLSSEPFECNEPEIEIIELPTCPNCGAPLLRKAELKPARAGPTISEILKNAA